MLFLIVCYMHWLFNAEIVVLMLCFFICFKRGNPILKFVRNVPWEFGDIIPDYQLGSTSCALYLRQVTDSFVYLTVSELQYAYWLFLCSLSLNYYYYTHLMASSRTTWISRYQKGWLLALSSLLCFDIVVGMTGKGWHLTKSEHTIADLYNLTV